MTNHDDHRATDIDQQRRRRSIQAKKLALQEQNDFDDSVSLAWTRIKLAAIVCVLIFIASFLISGRSGWMLEWPVAFAQTFISMRITTIVTVVIVALALVLYFVVQKVLKNKGKSTLAARERSVTLVSVVVMIGAGLIIPSSAWYEARDILPEVKFNRCVDSLRNDAVVALNDGSNGTKYATIASATNGVNKYALEPNQDGNWQVTDMYTNEKVENLAGC